MCGSPRWRWRWRSRGAQGLAWISGTRLKLPGPASAVNIVSVFSSPLQTTQLIVNRPTFLHNDALRFPRATHSLFHSSACPPTTPPSPRPPRPGRAAPLCTRLYSGSRPRRRPPQASTRQRTPRSRGTHPSLQTRASPREAWRPSCSCGTRTRRSDLTTK